MYRSMIKTTALAAALIAGLAFSAQAQNTLRIANMGEPDSRKSAHRLGGLDTSGEKLGPMEEAGRKSRRQPARITPYQDALNSV